MKGCQMLHNRDELYPVLQSRWKLEQDGQLYYYGLRCPPHTFHSRVRISSRTRKALCRLDGKTPLSQIPGYQALRRLIRQGIVVDASARRHIPHTLEESRKCARCAANDFIIPGLEFDQDGLCPFCALEQKTAGYQSILPLIQDFPKLPSSRYDAAVFYTGGKDSSYLLYQLAAVRGLKVLALTWELPFLSGNARQSIANAKKALPNVTFLSQKAPEKSLSAVYRKAYELQGNVCICPSVAYLLFYPLLVQEKVPYLILGNEPAQVRNLLFNGMAPPMAFSRTASRAALLLINTCRIASWKKPLSDGQFQMLAAIRQLLEGPNRFQRLLGYRNELVENIFRALQEAPDLLEPAREAYQLSKQNAWIPRLVHVDFQREDINGRYHWDSVKKLLVQELGWIPPLGQKGLHTSCSIERCKDYSQFIRFRDMYSRMIPFSAVEMSLASGNGSVGREQALEELERASGFKLDPPPEWEQMLQALGSGAEPEKNGAAADGSQPV